MARPTSQALAIAKQWHSIAARVFASHDTAPLSPTTLISHLPSRYPGDPTQGRQQKQIEINTCDIFTFLDLISLYRVAKKYLSPKVNSQLG